jgi:hypothetical protein
MSNLNAFLHPAQTTEVCEIIVSRRFLDADGRPVPFKVRPLTQEENDALTRRCMRSAKVNGQPVERLDSIAYSRQLVVAATVEPDFRSEELCKAYNTMDPLEVPGRMLLAGEYGRLSKEIMRLSGFAEDDLEEQAKN